MDYDLLPPGATFNLTKLGEKNPNPRGYPKEYLVMKIATVSPKKYIINGVDQVSLFFTGYKGDWFITSPLVSFDIETLKFETMNSYYQLECLDVP